MILKWELCFLFPFQNEYKCGYMLKSIVFGSFYHPFQDGYKNFRKTDIVSVASPGQDTSYLKPPSAVFFCNARTVTKSWCSVGMFFWQIHKFQIHKLVSRCDHLNISTMYSVFDWKEFLNIIIQAGIFREYRNKCFWRPKCFGKGTTSDYAVADIKREGGSSDYAVSEIRREMPFSPSVLHA